MLGMQEPDGIGPHHDPFAVGKIHYPHDAKNQHQTHCVQREKSALNETVYD